jgi:hypothetical protein
MNREAIVNKIRSWIGKNERDGSFKSIIDIYNSNVPLPRGYKVKYTDEWCATTVSAVAISTGAKSIIPIECSCQKMIERAMNMGIWQENDSYIPRSGDIIMYDWQDNGKGDNTGRPDHVGIVEKCDGTTITIIEGNKSQSVARRTLKVNGRYIRGYIVPNYTYDVPTSTYDIDKAADECIKGLHGSGKAREDWCNSVGLNYREVQNRINAQLGVKAVASAVSVATAVKPQNNVVKPSNDYVIGRNYKVLVKNLNIRPQPNTNRPRLTYWQLTKNARLHDSNRDGRLDVNTVVTCKGISHEGNRTWVKIPSGWLCACENGNKYIG